MNTFNKTRELMQIFIDDNLTLSTLTTAQLKDLIITFFEEQESLEIVDQIEDNLYRNTVSIGLLKELKWVFIEKLDQLWNEVEKNYQIEKNEDDKNEYQAELSILSKQLDEVRGVVDWMIKTKNKK